MIMSNWYGQNGEYYLLGSLQPDNGDYFTPKMTVQHQDVLLAEKIGEMCPFVQAVEVQEDVVTSNVQWMIRQSQVAREGAEVWDWEALTKVG